MITEVIVMEHRLSDVPADSPISSSSGETLQVWINLVRDEYLEMPGLSLTEAQVGRMWNLSPVLARTLLWELQRARFLRFTKTGTYVRADLWRN